MALREGQLRSQYDPAVSILCVYVILWVILCIGVAKDEAKVP